MSDFDRRKEDLLAKVNMTDLVDVLGLERKGKEARCPDHDDHGRPNLHIYPNRVHCFSCGYDADAFGLVAKVKGLDFKGAFDFLASRYGLPLIGDYRKSNTQKGKAKGSGLGYGRRAGQESVYPKAAPLPDTPSPTLDDSSAGKAETAILGYARGDAESTTYPKAVPLPDDQIAAFPTFSEAWAYWQAVSLAFDARLYKDPATCLFQVGRAQPLKSPSSLRVQVFTDLLTYTVAASTADAGRWLQREKGLTGETLDAFGIAFLADWERADSALRLRHGADILGSLGLLNKEGCLIFNRHRLLFPFFWKGEPVDVQGRDFKATDKRYRFLNTRGANSIPYNADALLQAKATGAPVFVCEGATDTLTLAQAGKISVGIVGVGGFKVAWLPYFDGLKVFLAFDADDAGQKAAGDVGQLFVNAGQPAPRIVRLPAGVKDVNEFFRGVK